MNIETIILLLILVGVAVAIFLIVTNAYAYLDPGTGSMLLSSIFSLFAVAMFSVKNALYKIVRFIGVLFGKQVKQEKKYGLVVYNEGEQYFSTFFPVLRELVSKGVDFTYIYSDPNDSMLSALSGIDAIYIGKGNKAFFFLNRLEAQMVVSTTPGLDVLQIKKSKGVKHYCHLHHASRGAAIYKVFSFDYYDSNLLACAADEQFFTELYNVKMLFTNSPIAVVLS